MRLRLVFPLHTPPSSFFTCKFNQLKHCNMRKILTTILLMLLSFSVGAQSNTVVVKGFTRDAEGRALIGVKIEAVGENISTISSQGGAFELRVSPYCRYVKATLEGYFDVMAEIDGTILVFRMKYDAQYVENKAKAEKEAQLAAEKSAKQEKRAQAKAERGPRKGRFFASFNLAMPSMKEPDNLAYGAMLGWGSNKVVGGYVKGLFGGGIDIDTHGAANSDEWCWEYNGYAGTTVRSRYNAFTAGALFRMGCPLNLYAGIGTSWRKVVYWNAIDGHPWIVSDKSRPQFCIDFGLMWRAKWFNVSAGTIYTPKFGFVGNLGVGACF